MTIKIKYGQSILSLPREPLEENLPSLSQGELQVLLYLLINSDFRADPEGSRARAVRELDMQWGQIEESLGCLCSHGVIELPDAETAQAPEPKKNRASVKADSPSYTKEETAAIIDRSTELKGLIDNVSRALGKMLSTGEASTVVSMYDYLRLSPQFIIMLTEYCVSIEKSSLRYIERMAYSLFDLDITSTGQLSAYLENEKRKDDTVSRIRKLFGVGERAFTPKEKKLIDLWLDTYGYTYEIIEAAYELTVSAINEASLPYAGAIMKKWFESGFKTLEAVTEGTKKQSAAPKKKPVKKAESFDADEFMDLAIARSYRKKSEEDK